MLQYVSGGKWGLLLRRPLEAMTRTLPLVALMFLPIIFLGKYLYQWMRFPTIAATNDALAHGLINKEQALTANFKHNMLNPGAMIVSYGIIFAILITFQLLLNKWSLQRDADPLAGTEQSFERWRTKFENLSGPGILICDHLDQVARRHLVLVDLGAAVPGGRGLRGARAGYPHRDPAVALRADEDHPAHHRAA
jgi:hypothetical protein